MVSSVPRFPRLVLILFAFSLLGACAVHVIDLWQHGWLPYHFAPLPLNAYWTSLTFLDLLAAMLLLCWPRAGLFLALLIITTDVALNLFARFYLGLHLWSVALVLQSLFFLAVAASTLYVRRTGAATLAI